jgi:hypothetical protein
MHIIPALGRLRQKNPKFEVSLDYISKFKVSLGYLANPVSKTKNKAKYIGKMIQFFSFKT